MDKEDINTIISLVQWRKKLEFLRKLQKEHPLIDLEIDIESAEYVIMN